MKRLLLAAVGVLAVASIAATPSCGTQVHKSCDTRIIQPAAPYQRKSGEVIIRAVARSWCDDPVLTYHVHLIIDYRQIPTADWTPQAATDYNTCAQLPSKDHPVDCVLPAICRPGFYRTRASLTGSNTFEGDFAFTLPEQPITRVANCH
jgi:hypothetical protein